MLALKPQLLAYLCEELAYNNQLMEAYSIVTRHKLMKFIKKYDTKKDLKLIPKD